MVKPGIQYWLAHVSSTASWGSSWMFLPNSPHAQWLRHPQRATTAAPWPTAASLRELTTSPPAKSRPSYRVWLKSIWASAGDQPLKEKLRSFTQLPIPAGKNTARPIHTTDGTLTYPKIDAIWPHDRRPPWLDLPQTGCWKAGSAEPLVKETPPRGAGRMQHKSGPGVTCRGGVEWMVLADRTGV